MDGHLNVQQMIGKRWTVGTVLTGPYFRLVVAPHEVMDVIHEGNAIYIQIRGKNEQQT